MKKIISYGSIAGCLILLFALLGCAGDRVTRSTGEFVDDSVLANKVKTALYADEDVAGTRIEVEAFKGVVQLSGFVNSPRESSKAMTIARNIKGVKEVRNNMIVKTQ